MNTENALTFYKLLKEKTIIIPKIQRDYAQGRVSFKKRGEEDTSAKPYQVRTGLVDAFYNCLVLGGNNAAIDKLNYIDHVDLNFVYGKVENLDSKEVFIPIDGQQRLTALFLLHWYIYWRCDPERRNEKIKDLGDKFSYESRETTKSFCTALCSLGTNQWSEFDSTTRIEKLRNCLSDGKTAEQNKKKVESHLLSTAIRNKVWFVSRYDSDPSVRSMLVMLDTIEKRFIQVNQETFSDIAQRLESDECPITFSYLGVGNFDDRDMYIKMNARGKELTNFELFKAKLEETPEILKDVCYTDGENREDRISEFIGKYNNTFTNLFYSNIGKMDFDKAMFNFIQCIVKMDHFAYISSSTAIEEKKYRDYISNYTYSGSSFFSDYIGFPTLHGYSGEQADTYKDELRQVSKRSLVKITQILSFLSKVKFEEFPITKEDEYKQFALIANINEERVFKVEKELFYKNCEDPSNIMSVVQWAILSFLYEVDLRNSIDFNAIQSAYIQWKRFVLNTVAIYNSKETANIAKMAGIYNYLLQKIKEKYLQSKSINDFDILDIISNYSSYGLQDNMSITSIDFVFKREERKAKLMTGPNASGWKSSIIDAENYYIDGDLDFLLEEVDCVDPAVFTKRFNRSKKWLTKEKTPMNDVLFNEALLCADYPADNKTAHLYNIDSERWQFYYGSSIGNVRKLLNWPDEKQLRVGFLSLLSKDTKDEADFYENGIAVDCYVQKLIDKYRNVHGCELRNALISYRVLSCIQRNSNKYAFSGTIGLWHGGNQAGPKEYVLFRSSAYNSLNIEFMLYLLYAELQKAGMNVELELRSGLPRDYRARYLICDDQRIGYDVERHLFVSVNDGTEYPNIEVAIQKIKAVDRAGNA